MQREIKYRAWDKFRKRMYHVGSLHFDIAAGIAQVSINIPFEGLCKEFSFNDIELMQYTGLKDKNGVEIYEGDIVSDEVFNYIIKWIDFGFWKVQIGQADKYKSGLHNMKYYERAGNIYENPNLLDQEDNQDEWNIEED